MINVGSLRVARLLPGRWITTRNDGADRSLYLTFDDGPDPNYSLPICDLLDQFDVKATFFCVGKNLEKHPEIASEIVARGHLLGNHSNTHFGFSRLPLDHQVAEIQECQLCIQKVDGDSPKLFRAPQGRLGIRLLRKLKSLGWHIVHWSYDSKDYAKGDVDRQLSVFRDSPVKSGDIVLFHDDNQLAIELLKRLLPEWKAQGFRMNTVKELIAP